MAIISPKYKLSVRLMTYMHESFVNQAMDGIMMQKTDFKIEVVVGDDFSTDRTLEIIKSYKNTESIDVKILKREKGDEYWRKRQKLGRLYNFTNILENCTGKYIALLDGDDYWTDPLKLQKQLDFLEGNEEYSFCFTRFQTKDERTNTFLDDENSKHFDKNQSFIDYDFERFYKGWHIGTQTVMFINTPETKNFYKQYQLPRDMHLYVELLKQGKGACLKDFCAVYRLTGKGVYTSTSKFQQIIKGAKVYEDIYKSNKDIIFIELKYRKFFKSYLRMLASNKNILGYVVQMFKSFKITKKVNYLKEDSIFLFKKFYSKL